MHTGTKSLLFGVHQFLWHPLTVLLAWIELYGAPTVPEMVCILVHDIGYAGKPNMDGPEGETHPELGAKIAGWLCGEKARLECLGHSRRYAEKAGIPVSRLCWADKLSPKFEPTPFYWIRATLSGELAEYRRNIPWAKGEGSFQWVKTFKHHVKENSAKIAKGAKGIAAHGYVCL